MIPLAYITAWRKNAPWQENYQVEQDIIIVRALLEIFGDPFLKEHLAFRGGTALYKLYLRPVARYSEDIDLVQIKSGPFGPIIDKLRIKLNFLGKPVVKQKQSNNTLLFRFTSEDNVNLKIKVEVNCREHYSLYDLCERVLGMESEWHNGEVSIPTYKISELLGTKLRALYQRKKGRDLFDLWYAINQLKVDTDEVIESWKFYMLKEHHNISQNEFLSNMDSKISDSDFIGDMTGLLRPDLNYNIEEAYEFIKTELLSKIK